MSSIDLTSERRFGKIADAIHHSGVSRATLYIWASRHPGLFRKSGASTVVDFAVLDTILNDLPIANIKMKAARKTATA
jgi:hypothetical protein